jgi:hypothetical protein
VDEFLSAKTGIDGHHQQQINLVEVRQNFGDGGGRIDRQADLFAEGFDFPDERRNLFAQLKCTMISSAPAAAKGSSRISGREHIKWTSKKSLVSGRTARTTSGPKEMFGTKWPSMMSRCSQSAPERLARSASLPKRAGRPPAAKAQ